MLQERKLAQQAYGGPSDVAMVAGMLTPVSADDVRLQDVHDDGLLEPARGAPPDWSLQAQYSGLHSVKVTVHGPGGGLTYRIHDLSDARFSLSNRARHIVSEFVRLHQVKVPPAMVTAIEEELQLVMAYDDALHYPGKGGYHLAPVIVSGVMRGEPKVLMLDRSVQPNATESMDLLQLMLGLVSGNKLRYVIERRLTRFFIEVPTVLERTIE